MSEDNKKNQNKKYNKRNVGETKPEDLDCNAIEIYINPARCS